MKLNHTNDIPAGFETKLKEICARNGWHWKDMLSVMMSESGVYAHAHNDNPKDRPKEQRYNAVGLIQFMPKVLESLSFEPNEDQEKRGLNRWQSMLELNALEQLPWVEKFFKWWKGEGLTSAARFYQATFLPATLRNGSKADTVISAKDGYLGWAYTANAGFDANKDGKITVGELAVAIDRNCRGPRWAELLYRFGETPTADDGQQLKDLSTKAGVQAALESLGYYKGAIDGLWGPLSDKALRGFQKAQGLQIDGIFGPESKGALESFLNKHGQGVA